MNEEERAQELEAALKDFYASWEPWVASELASPETMALLAAIEKAGIV